MLKSIGFGVKSLVNKRLGMGLSACYSSQWNCPQWIPCDTKMFTRQWIASNRNIEAPNDYSTTVEPFEQIYLKIMFDEKKHASA